MAVRTVITLPASAKPGEVIEVRTLIAHPMESGFRPDSNGRLLPRDILRRFECRYGGEVVFAAALAPAVAANPYIAFTLRAGASGPLQFTWQGDNGFEQTETRMLTVA